MTAKQGWLLAVALFATPAAMTFPACAAGEVGPYLMIAPAETTPTVDGEIRPDEWSGASSPTALVDISTHSAAREQPQVLLTWDAEALYVAARLPVPRGHTPVARVTRRDGEVWEDDALELFVDPGSTRSDYLQFIVNSAGVQWDSRRRDPSWDADWVARTSVGADAWTAELKIPFASLGLLTPTSGEIWGLNVAWDRRTPTPLIASWGHVTADLHEPRAFGRLQFADDAPAIQITGPLRPGPARLAVAGTWRSAVPLVATLTVTQQGADGARQVAKTEARRSGDKARTSLRLEATLPREGGYVAPGEYQVAATVTQMGQVVYQATTPLRIRDPLLVAVRKYMLQGALEVEVDASGLERTPAEVNVALMILALSGRRLHREVLSRTSWADGMKSTRTLDVSTLAPGEYKLAVVATSPRGSLIKRLELPFTRPVTPSWLGSREGISDEVLAPWTPVEVAGDTVRVWGREYSFGALPFPRNVTTGGETILAGPITLKLVADGQEKTWTPGADLQVLVARPNRAELATTATAAGWECAGRIAVEYDGMIRSDFTVKPDGPSQVEELALIVPIREQYAGYLYHFPGRWGSAYNAGALPQTGFTGGFRPFIWLGDEQRGFAWFCESDRNFLVDDPGQVTQIGRDSGVVTLRVNMLRGQQRVDGPLEYTFGFQATPVKPLKPDVWDYRICHHGGYGIQEQEWSSPAWLTYPAEGLINLEQGTFEAWVRPQFNPQPEVRPDDPQRGRLNRSLFSVDFGDGDMIGFYWNIDDRGMRVYYKRGDQYPLVQGARSDWNQGEWHHVALTWGDRTAIWVDGEKVTEAEHRGTLLRSLAGARITLGKGAGDPCDFDVDEVRISDVARDRFDLTGPPAADEHTLLLDRLDDPLPEHGPRTTRPQVGAAAEVQGGQTVEGRFGGALALRTVGPKTTVLDRLAQLGVRTICFHEHWTDIQNYTSTTHGEQLHKLVKACHDRGIQLLLYFGYEMSDIAPEWDLYAEECLVYPRSGGYHRLPEQHAYIVCYRSKWQDFMADGIARVMDEYDIDGVYLDGTAYPWGCSNLRHGCGFQRPDGSIGTTYPIFATREMMRRIYTIVKTRKPQGQVNVHNSTLLTIPTLSWATSTWDGEQFGGLAPGPDPLAVLPLDAFRCEFMGRQWGVPAEFLCYNQPYTMEQATAFTLLHDVLVRGSLGGSLETNSKLWEGMERFGRDGAVWLPYWENQDYVQVSPAPSVKVSLYSRSESGLVAVVSNLSSTAVTASVTLDRQGLSLPARLRAQDMLTGEPVEVSAEGGISFPLQAYAYRVIWVQPE